MARIRTIKPEFWTSEQVANCSRDARLLFVGMWNFCDDAGIHPKSYKRLKLEILPGDNCSDDDIKRWVTELIQVGLIVEYSVDETHYWMITGWHHQRIEKPNYRYPKPKTKETSKNNELNIPQPVDDQSASTLPPVDDYSTNIPLPVDDHSRSIRQPFDPVMEGNGMERNGRERYIRQVSGETFLSNASVENDLIANTQEPDVCDEQEEHNRASQEPQRNNPVQEIFQHWKTKLDHPRAQLDEKRRRKIKAAIKLGFSVDELKQAIDGCAHTPFNMGQNKNQQRYDAISLIFRDRDHIERFIENNLTLGSQIKNKYVYQPNPIFEGAI